MINNNLLFGFDGLYTSQPIEQCTDRLTNQTSFCVNFHNAYNLMEYSKINHFNDLKCKYCKAFYFPQMPTKSQSKKLPLKNMINTQYQTRTYTCQLCESINDIHANNQSIKQFPKFIEPQTKEKEYQFNSNFQSIIVSETKSVQNLSKIKPINKNENHLIFVFCIDLDVLSIDLQMSTLTYLKTVIKEYFTQHMQKISSKNYEEHQFQQQIQKQKQNYSIILTFSMHEKLFVADINTMSTICIDSLLKQKVISGIPGQQDMKQFHQKENERKENLIELLYKASAKLDRQESLQKFSQYIEMLIEDRQQNTQRSKISIQGSLNYTKLMQLLSFDKSSCHSYVISWISSTPIINYEPHRVKKSNIYSIVYLFCQQQSPQDRLPKNSFTSQMKFHQSNVRNELLLIKQNNQVRFIDVSTSQQDNTEFYYLLYELFTIVDAPKIFRPKWSIKTDAKYPPILTNDPPPFFIKNPTLLYFIVSSLIDKGSHSKFQISVQFEDWKKQQQLWIINWTKDSQKQLHQLKSNSHKQIQLIPKMSQIYNYFHILVKFMMNVAIRGKNDISQGKKQLLSLNTVTGNQFCMIIQSMINHGVFRANNIEIGIEYLSKMYDYLNKMKGVPFEVLRFLSSCQYNIRRAILMIFPLVVYPYQQLRSCLLYWSSGYLIVDDQDDDENGQYEERWTEKCVSVINQYENKYYTKQFNISSVELSHNYSQGHIVRYYLQNANIIQFQQQQNPYHHNSQPQKSHAINYNSLTSSISIYYQNNLYQQQNNDNQYA